MKYRCLVLVGVFVAVASVAMPGQAPRAKGSAAAPAKPWAQPRTVWGDPDLQGIWRGLAHVPLERPRAFAGREFLTDAEVAARIREIEERQAIRAAGEAVELGTRSQPNYNGIFTLADKYKVSRRTSAIIDPPDGRLPRLTPEAVK